jgi:medium-chain acyl-[acyl-carrier-protein] hydrolase
VTSRSDNRVALVRRSVGTPSVTLVCVPFAGGNPEVFGAWVDYLAEDVELVAVRLPGHGSRIRELPFANWDDLISDTCDALACYVSRPHALYGHCFGGRLAYEVAQRNAALGIGRLLRRLFVSSCRSPDASQPRPYVHELPDREFCSALAQTGAAPLEVLRNEALMRILLPVVHAEIRLAELWGGHGTCPISAPITAIRGREDTSPEGQRMVGWSAFTTGGYEFAEVQGGHFFLQTDPGPALEFINSRLVSPACES